MKKNIKFFAVAIAAIMTLGNIFFTSCNKNEEFSLPNHDITSASSATKECQDNLGLSQQKRNDFAKHIASKFATNPAAFLELNTAINAVVGYGLDEVLPFFDILNPANSVFFQGNTAFINLQNVLVATNVETLLGFDGTSYYGNLQFYWPYHDDWNPSLTTLVCFAPENASASSTQGYYVSNGNVHEVTINASDIDDGSVQVIIINKSETLYSDFPDFANGVRSKNGVHWSLPGPGIPTYVGNGNSTGNNTIYEARTYSMKSSGEQYDLPWAGGSEFEFRSAYSKDGSNITITPIERKNFTRKQIKNHESKRLDLQIHENWQPRFDNVFVCLTEKDDWNVTISPIEISIDIDSIGTLSTTIYISDKDDSISCKSLQRDNYFHRCDVYDGLYTFDIEEVNCLIDIYDSYSK